jgi:hypothetical protein
VEPRVCAQRDNEPLWGSFNVSATDFPRKTGIIASSELSRSPLEKGESHAAVLRQVAEIIQSIVKKVETRVKAWTKPATDSQMGGIAADLVKSKPALIAENAFFSVQPELSPVPAWTIHRRQKRNL